MVLAFNHFMAQHVLQKQFGKWARRYLGRSFPRNSNRRLAVYFEPNAISFSQVYPFVYYADLIRETFNVEVRCISNGNLLAGIEPRADQADIVLLQTWFTISPENMGAAILALRRVNPQASISFLDSFAHNDIRLSKYLAEDVDFYLKKSLFKDKSLFFKSFAGGTNLTEYYGGLYGIEDTALDWQAPKAILKKLQLSPNFFTASQFLTAFATRAAPSRNKRRFDIHTRLGQHGTPWYQAMREHSMQSVKAISGLQLSPDTKVSWARYMAEMARSKLCFSPFGYGELCWRDVEAILTGSVLIKPDMGHLETRPDIYQPGVTYLPVKWDFSDLESVVSDALADDDKRGRIAEKAFQTVAKYLRQAQFVEDMTFLFESSAAPRNNLVQP